MGLAGWEATTSPAQPPIRVDLGTSVVREIKSMVTDEIAIGGRVDFAMLVGGRVRDDVELGFAMAASGPRR